MGLNNAGSGAIMWLLAETIDGIWLEYWSGGRAIFRLKSRSAKAPDLEILKDMLGRLGIVPENS